MRNDLPSFDEECFFITPIGKKDSTERRRADGVLRSIVEPAAAEVGLTVVRADQIAKGGQVNLQIIEHICKAASAVADLTGGNLNVYYEVGMRHAVRKPLALMADESENLPFDLLQQRTIFFANDLEGAATCRDSLRDQLQNGINGVVDSPVDAALNVGVLAQGDETQRALADLVQKVDALTSDVHRGLRGRRAPSPAAIADLAEAYANLTQAAAEQDDGELSEIAGEFSKPVKYLTRQFLGANYPNTQKRARADAIQALLGDTSTPSSPSFRDSPDTPEDQSAASDDDPSSSDG